MAYGEQMKKLSPCDSETVLLLLLDERPAPGALLDVGCGRGERLADCAAALPGRGFAASTATQPTPRRRGQTAPARRSSRATPARCPGRMRPSTRR